MAGGREEATRRSVPTRPPPWWTTWTATPWASPREHLPWTTRARRRGSGRWR
uniref:Uncharacterized protein n=1 Tax=Arundo donax TaxID=35708 RepID=A0A0A9EC56_ARUDO